MKKVAKRLLSPWVRLICFYLFSLRFLNKSRYSYAILVLSNLEILSGIDGLDSRAYLSLSCIKIKDWKFHFKNHTH